MKEKKYWQINTEKLAKETIEIARKANTEEDLKMGMEPLLQKAFKKMGIDIDIVRYEKTSTSFRGRPDAVYGYLTIEYKSPGKLSKKTDAKLAMEQLQRYLGEQAIEFGVFMHGHAGEYVAHIHNLPPAILAGDIVDILPDIMTEFIAL